MKKSVGKASVVFFSIIVSLIVLELVLRLAGNIYYLKTHKKTKKVSQENDVFTILTVGESTTYGFPVESNSYPIQLEKMLNEEAKCLDCFRVEVLAWPGAATSELLLRFSNKLQEIKPDIVIIMTGANYYQKFSGNSLLYTLREIYSGSNEIPNWQITALEKIFKLRLVKVWIWWEQSLGKKLFGIDPAKAFLGDEKYTWPPTKETLTFVNKYEQIIHRQLGEELKKFIFMARNEKAAPVLMTYPFDDDKAQEFLRSIAEEENAPFVNQAQNLSQAVKVMGFEALVTPIDQWHPNELGYWLMAKNVHTSLKDMKLIPDYTLRSGTEQ